MSEEISFIDPAFTCRVILTGTASALYTSAKSQFERLESIRSLGLIAQIQTVARHTRHQHLVGLMRIFNKLSQQPPKKGLPKEMLWSFWCRLCFGQTGHAALGYDTEKAVLLACHTDAAFKEKLRNLLLPVARAVAPCIKCEITQCVVNTKGPIEAEVWLNELISENRWYSLHLWVAALKLIQNQSLLGILEQQVVGDRNRLGFFKPDAVKMMIAPTCKWESVFRNLTRLDFIPRDLAFAGTIGIRLDVDSLVAAANEKHPDWKLLSSLSAYMSDNIYESPEQQFASALYQRALATLLISDKLSLDQIFGFDLNVALSDENLKAVVEKTPAGKQVFDPELRQGWKVWPVKTYIEPNRIPSEVEKEISGHAKGHLYRHILAKVTCVKLRQKHSLVLAIRHRGLTDKPEAKAFVKICRSLLSKQMPRIDTEDLADALFEGLVDRECEHGLDAAILSLSKLSLPLRELKASAEIVNRKAAATGKESDSMTIQFGGFSYPFHGDPREVQLNAMHAAILGDDSVRKNLGITLTKASETLWGEVLRWQSFYFGLRPSRTLLNLLKKAQDLLGQLVVSGAPSSESNLEYYTLLEALKHPCDTVSFRVVLPNLKLMKPDGQPENEYDVVAVTLKEDQHVEVWVWGVTIEQNLAPKRARDFLKIQKLKDLLGERWRGDVTVRTCYIHKEGSDICCEIDGRQERRAMEVVTLPA